MQLIMKCVSLDPGYKLFSEFDIFKALHHSFKAMLTVRLFGERTSGKIG